MISFILLEPAEIIRWVKTERTTYERTTRTPTPTLIRGNPALRTRNTVSLGFVKFCPVGPNVKILQLPSCGERQWMCIYFFRKCHGKCISHSILTFRNYRQTSNIIFTWFYLLKFSSQSMKWTYDHNIIFVREILLQAPWLHRCGTTERGEVWSKIADNLNAMEKTKL